MSKIKDVTSKIKQNAILFLLQKAINNKIGRKIILNRINKKLDQSLEKESKTNLRAVQQKKYQWVKALIKQFFKNYNKGYISKHVSKKALEVLGLNNFFKDTVSDIVKTRESFEKKYGVKPSSFIVISPTQVCNLKCKGCYASSSPETGITMSFDVLDRILKENHDILGSRFVVVSGGEPMMYKSQGKTLLDIFEKYNDTFFLFYTNGTLITKEVAERLVKAGNAYPQISVEGFEEETDWRRGKGVFQRILKTMGYLREAGVPFSLSVTGTRRNINTLLSDEFYDFWFEKQGASYMWQFQLMPIGRGKGVFDLMPIPEERVKLYRKWEDLIKRGYPIADFWNSGVLSDGCIAYGRNGGGYFYIDWNGNVMPCVFIPYYVDNVYDLYKQGKTLANVLLSDFFKKGREWQNKYGLACPKKAKNWLMPCSIRDNYKYFREVILPNNAKPEDKFAQEARDSKEYFESLIKYDKELKERTQPIWEREYLKGKEKDEN